MKRLFVVGDLGVAHVQRGESCKSKCTDYYIELEQT